MELPKINEEKWIKDFVALLKEQTPPGKTDEELEEFAKEMFAEARRRGEAMSKIVVED